MDAKAGTTSNTIEGVYTVSYNCKTQERQQLSIEGARCCEISSSNKRWATPLISIDLSSAITPLQYSQLDDRQYTAEQPVQGLRP